MLFDDLCRLAERTVPELRPLCRRARLFRIEGSSDGSSDVVARESVDKMVIERWTDDERLVENLRLPFDTIVLEEAPERQSRGEHCILLHAEDKGRQCTFYSLHAPRPEPGMLSSQTRLDRGRVTFFPDGFIEPGGDQWSAVRIHDLECSFIKRDELESPGQPDLSRLGAAYYEGGVRDAYVRSRQLYETLRQQFEETQDPEVRAQLREVYRTHGIELEKQLRTCQGQAAFGTLMVALAHLLNINQPAAFIVEEQPLANIREPKPGQLLRSPWRSHYIVLEPRAIRERLRLAHPEDEPGSTRAPHERRGHFRRFHSDRFKNVRGQMRWIESMWVGPREAVLGPNRYLVRTDL